MGKKWVLALALSIVLPGAARAGQRKGKTHGNRGHWVGTWASAPQLGDQGNAPPEPGFVDSTLRQIAHVSLGGKQIRVRFSNGFGATPLAIASAHVALAAGGGAIRPESDQALAFHGQPSVTIPPGALMYSDPVDFDLVPLCDLAVTIRLHGVPEGVTAHPGSRATSYLAAGDSVSAADLPAAAHTDHWYFLNGIDVLASHSSAAIVTLGDSITDGRNSTTNANHRWPDELARRLQANRGTRKLAVLNEGIGGNRLLLDGLGPNALARLDRDVLSQPGVRWLIVLEGVNDIGTGAKAEERHEPRATAEALMAAYDQIILRAHAHDIRVYGATISPFADSSYFSAETEAERQGLNTWIRNSGKFDAVIDFDAAIRDARNPSHLAPTADSGDHLHPGDRGYKIMSDTIDLRLFAE